MNVFGLRAVCSIAFLVVVVPAGAQVIPIKTIPIAQGDQFQIYPSNNLGLGGVSIALADSLGDPFANPATTARLRGSWIFSAPTVYSVSRRAGGGRSLPLAMLARQATWYGGLALVLHRVDLLYSGSIRVKQTGHAIDVRMGAWKEWPGERGARSLEAIVLHNRFAATHNVLYADQVWDPALQRTVAQLRTDQNFDHTNTWGAQLKYQIPLATPGWRIGWILTVNRATHPKLPNYEITNVAVIPWDPGRSYAYDLGVGLSKVLGRETFGVDALYEPIRSYTWADAIAPTATLGGDTIATGGKTVENRFRFSNAVFRIGVGRDIDLEGLQFGLMMRSICYRLEQTNHVELTQRALRTGWLEWTPTWGLTLRFPDLELRYRGRVTK